MARILLALMCLSGWSLSTCLQYHYIADNKTWTEAQAYCRQTYRDLATIGNIEQSNKLLDTITSAGQSSEVWMGLYHTIEWRWSDGLSGVGANYSNWKHLQPNFFLAGELCVSLRYGWLDENCSARRRFVCYNGSQLDPEVFLVNSYVSWPNAQLYCRQHYVDLVTVTNGIVEEKIIREIGSAHAWIGLHRAPNFFWSDGSSFTFSNWNKVANILNSMKVMCAVTSSTVGGKWRLLSCEEKLPFVCYSIPQAKTLQLKIASGNPAVDLNDPAVKEDLLKKLEERLNLQVVGGVKLKWRNPQDGKVFKKLHTVVDSRPIGPKDCKEVHV